MTDCAEPLNFSTAFGVDHDLIEGYGALDISLINDLPLFIDPFLLFASDKPEYGEIHQEMIRYLLFLKDRAAEGGELSEGMFQAWFAFPEVKQTWLGFSKTGNSGRGMGRDFARGLYDGFRTFLKDFGKEEMLASPHMEKLCLVRRNIGKDKISDFTAHFALHYLLEYTERFAKQHMDPSQLDVFSVSKVVFDYESGTWQPRTYTLPTYGGDYVLLTPRDMLTRDDTFLNRRDMIDRVAQFASSVGDSALRFELERFIRNVLEGKERLKKSERDKAVEEFIAFHPEVVNYYIEFKEMRKEEAQSLSDNAVAEIEHMLIEGAAVISRSLSDETAFYAAMPSSYYEVKRRVAYLKHVIEDCDGYQLLWGSDHKPLKEKYAQLLFKFVWYASPYDVNREPNNGRGPVDYAASMGAADKSLVEFKLAGNTQLRSNLEKQVDVYKNANGTGAAVTVVLYFTAAEYEKVTRVMNELGIAGADNIVLIDARRDNKPTGSKA